MVLLLLLLLALLLLIPILLLLLLVLLLLLLLLKVLLLESAQLPAQLLVFPAKVVVLSLQEENAGCVRGMQARKKLDYLEKA